MLIRSNGKTQKNELFESEKRRYLLHLLSDEGFKAGAVVNRALPSFHGASLTVTLTVPLNMNLKVSVLDIEFSC